MIVQCLGCCVILAVTKSVLEGIRLVTSHNDPDIGSTYKELICNRCKTVVGRLYKTTPKHLDDIRGLFCFDVDQITSYNIGSGEVCSTIPTESKDHSDQSVFRDFQTELVKVRSLTVGLHVRLENLEARHGLRNHDWTVRVRQLENPCLLIKDALINRQIIDSAVSNQSHPSLNIKKECTERNTQSYETEGPKNEYTSKRNKHFRDDQQQKEASCISNSTNTRYALCNPRWPSSTKLQVSHNTQNHEDEHSEQCDNKLPHTQGTKEYKSTVGNWHPKSFSGPVGHTSTIDLAPNPGQRQKPETLRPKNLQRPNIGLEDCERNDQLYRIPKRLHSSMHKACPPSPPYFIPCASSTPSMRRRAEVPATCTQRSPDTERRKKRRK